MNDEAKKFDQICLVGVFPPVVRWAVNAVLWSEEEFPSVWIYESFNINRAIEGAKPEFEHDSWLLTQTFNE